jgi:hypothetical protein
MDWSEVEPILQATYRLLNEEESTTPEAVCEALGRLAGDEGTIRALALLYEDGYIGGNTIEQSPAPIFIEATGQGLRQTSGWPREGGGAELVELLLRLLDERIADDETPEEEKGKLRRARDAFAGLGRDVAVGVLTALVSHTSGASGGG